MEDIVFCNFSFERLAVRGRVISENLTVKFRGYGTFELHLPLTDSEIIGILEQNEYIFCVQGENQAVVTGWRLDEDIAVFGKTPEWLLTKYILPKSFSVSSVFPDEAARRALTKVLGSNVTFGDYRITGGKTVTLTTDKPQTLYEFISDTLHEVTVLDSNRKLVAVRPGFRLRADVRGKKLVFYTLMGDERKVILSQSDKSAYGMIYTRELEDKTTGGVWYQKKTTAEDGTESVEWTQTAAGSQTGLRKWSAVLSETLTDDELKKKTDNLAASENIECDVRRLELGRDYDIGDTVRVRFETEGFKKTLKRYVTGVEIYNDTDGCGVRPVLEVEL